MTCQTAAALVLIVLLRYGTETMNINIDSCIYMSLKETKAMHGDVCPQLEQRVARSYPENQRQC